MNKKRVAVLGAGLGGLGAGAALQDEDVVVYEKRAAAGGHASTHDWNGFVFDEGPHISFTKNEKIRGLFADSVEQKFWEHPGIATNYFEGVTLKHPAQVHLYPLPVEIKKKCLVDMIKALSSTPPEPVTYKDWCYRNFGESFSEIFVRKYTRKYWTKELEDLTVDWVGPRIHAPTVEQVVDGALQETEENFNYIMKFRYPKEGGFAAFLKRMVEQNKDIRYGYELKNWDPVKKTLSFTNGKIESYDCLVSTLPLTLMIELSTDAPSAVRKAAEQLECTSHFLVNVGLRGEPPKDAYWVYYYDEDIPFSRVSFPSKLSPGSAPKGHWSLQAEVVHSKEKPLGDPEAVTQGVLKALKKVGLIRQDSDVVLVKTQDIKYANVVFSKPRVAAVKTVHQFLEEKDVFPCGRYGEWAYLWTDESYLSGEKAAMKAKQRMRGN